MGVSVSSFQHWLCASTDLALSFGVTPNPAHICGCITEALCRNCQLVHRLPTGLPLRRVPNTLGGIIGAAFASCPWGTLCGAYLSPSVGVYEQIARVANGAPSEERIQYPRWAYMNRLHGLPTGHLVGSASNTLSGLIGADCAGCHLSTMCGAHSAPDCGSDPILRTMQHGCHGTHV